MMYEAMDMGADVVGGIPIMMMHQRKNILI